MKPKPYEAQNTKFSAEAGSVLISCATFKFLNWPHRAGVRTKMYFHDSQGFHGCFENALKCVPFGVDM